MADLRLTRIDELLRQEHSYVFMGDDCYFIREYTSGGVGYQYSDTNNLISNLKKPVDRRGKPEWKYKERAIEQIATELRATVSAEYMARATWVPMPPSKSEADALYDDRLIRILKRMGGSKRLDIRQLLKQKASAVASHTTSDRPSPKDLEANLEFDDSLLEPIPAHIALFDDLITTGAHFRAATNVLTTRYPDVQIIGIFVARRVFPTEAER